MTATKDRPSKATITRVADHPQYAAEVAKLMDLRSQHSAAAQKVRELEAEFRRHSPGNQVEATAVAFVEGRSVVDVTTLEDQLQRDRLNELALHRAIELQEQNVRNAHRVATTAIHEAEQPRLDEHLANVMQSASETFDRIEALRDYARDLSERGAPLTADQFAGVLACDNVSAYFKLSTPEVVDIVRGNLREHWNRHYQRAAAKAGV